MMIEQLLSNIRGLKVGVFTILLMTIRTHITIKSKDPVWNCFNVTEDDLKKIAKCIDCVQCQN